MRTYDSASERELYRRQAVRAKEMDVVPFTDAATDAPTVQPTTPGDRRSQAEIRNREGLQV